MSSVIGVADVLLITFDALRFDVAAEAFENGLTPCLASRLPGGWEERHSPGSFTFASHAAIFAGFFPTPVSNPQHIRPFAMRFQGSRSIDRRTCVLDDSTLVAGLRTRGYHTVCVGGVGFFNRHNPLGRVFPDLFDESHWEPEFGVAHPHSTRAQVVRCVERIEAAALDRPLLLFLNLSATHPPTHCYLAGATGDSRETQEAALAYVDRHLPPLFAAFERRARPGVAFLMSDHGEAFGEDGYCGHRLAHPVVWTVPYAEVTWEGGP
jgi:hypothetical protein